MKIKLYQHEFSALFDSYRSEMNNNNTSFYYFGNFAKFLIIKLCKRQKRENNTFID